MKIDDEYFKHLELKSYFTDKDIAEILSVSPAWVRKQRYLRNRNKEHSLNLDCIYLGKSPRYRASDFYAWLKTLHN